MQILGKRSKVLLIAVAITMLVAIGISFAAWDSMSAVKAASGNTSTYANAKVGDEVEFGEYYQSKSDLTRKDPITWIVVDKDERTGQLTLMSKYILACGSYFGNWYDDGTGYNHHYNNLNTTELGNAPHNQAYVESTVRAYLNNLERLDMGGDEFTTDGYLPSNKNSTIETGLLSNVGFSNKLCWTNLWTDDNGQSSLLSKPGFLKRHDNSEIYYKRPITNNEYVNRPATKGFFDEAFTNTEKSMIVPKHIAGYTGYRWPDNAYDMSPKSYVEGAIDKVWLPSVTELNAINGNDWNSQPDNSWTNSSDEPSSTAFEYFKNLTGDALTNALKATRTDLATDGKAGNYSIPVYDKGTINVKTAISNSNTSDNYWTRSSSATWFTHARMMLPSGLFGNERTDSSYIGVRPCVILKY